MDWIPLDNSFENPKNSLLIRFINKFIAILDMKLFYRLVVTISVINGLVRESPELIT